MATGKKSASKAEDEEEDAEDGDEEAKRQRPRALLSEQVNLAEPLFFWVIVLVLALFARFVTTYTNAFPAGNQIHGFLVGASNFFLFSSGTLILPLIVGAVIGTEVGLKARSVRGALKAGAVNGAYAAIVYIISIAVIYEILAYALPASNVTLTFLINGLIVPQVLIVLVLVEIFAALSNGRKMGA